MNAKDLTLVVVAKDEQSMRGFDQTHVNAAETILVINYRHSTACANRKLSGILEAGKSSASVTRMRYSAPVPWISSLRPPGKERCAAW